MKSEISHTDTRTDEHSDCGSDFENTSHVADYRLDTNMSLTMPTSGRGIRRDYDALVSDDSSCEGDSELSPPVKRFKNESEDPSDGVSSQHYSKGKLFFATNLLI